MFCPKCGAQLADDARFCPSCGAEVKASEPAPATNPEPDFSQTTVSEPIFAVPTAEAAPKKSFREFLLAHNNQLFMVLCILMSVQVGAAFIGGLSVGGGNFSLNLPILPCLYMIFLWILFAKARSKTLDPKPIRWISTVYYVEYILTWVAVGLIVLAAIALIAGAAWVGSILDTAGFGGFGGLGASIFAAIAAPLLLIAAAVIALFNWFGGRRIVTFLKSLAVSAETDTEALVETKNACTWILVLGVISAVGAVFSITGNFLGFIGNACGAAAEIVGYILLKQMFLDAPKAQ